MRERRRVVYSGWVQGVGFRATALRVARGYEVAGFVRNLPDGRVELVAEGEAGTLDVVLDRIGLVLSEHIEGAEVTPLAVTGALGGFDIRG